MPDSEKIQIGALAAGAKNSKDAARVVHDYSSGVRRPDATQAHVYVNSGPVIVNGPRAPQAPQSNCARLSPGFRNVTRAVPGPDVVTRAVPGPDVVGTT